MQKLSIIILTYNEEDYIEGAIESAIFADEIIVVDSYSTDNTPTLIQKHDVVFIQHKFNDFSSQRFFAAEHASNTMILFLDADERISDLLKVEIQNVLNIENPKTAYKILFSHIFMGRQMKYGSYGNSWKLRLFNKNLCWYNEKVLVHEKIIVMEGKTGRLKHPIIHYGYRSWNHSIKKRQHYAELQAQQLFNKQIKPNIFHFVIKPIYRFFNEYFLRAGFLDGFPGFASAYMNANYVGTRYIKLWLLYRKMK